jgi:ketosteroid isomerase-like protein
VSEHVEVVRRVYDAATRRDREAVLALYDPDVEWDGSRSRWSEVMIGPPRLRGHAQLEAFFRNYHETWEDLEDELVDLFDAGGGRVISVVNTRARGRASGIEVLWEGNAGLWTVRDGRVTRVVWFATVEDALGAAGE